MQYIGGTTTRTLRCTPHIMYPMYPAGCEYTSSVYMNSGYVSILYLLTQYIQYGMGPRISSRPDMYLVLEVRNSTTIRRTLQLKDTNERRFSRTQMLIIRFLYLRGEDYFYIKDKSFIRNSIAEL